MTHITRLETNIKNLNRGGNGSTIFDLQKNVLLVGGNGSGKTAVFNAIELALTGQASDLGAKDTARAAKILADLIPQGEAEVYAEVTLSDGRVGRWSMLRGKAAKFAPVDGGEAHLPVHDAYTALSGSREKLVSYLYPMNPRENDNFPATIAITRNNVNAANAAVKAIQGAILYLGGMKNLPNVSTWPFRDKEALEHWELISSLETVARLKPEALSASLRQAMQEEERNPFEVKLSLFHAETPASSKVTPDVARLLRGLQEKLDSQKELLSHHKAVLVRQVNSCSVIVDEYAAAICAKINKHLPRPVSISSTETQCRLGWLGERGEPLPFTSGAETVQIAVALGLARHSHKIGDISVILTPDRSLDENTLASLQKNLGVSEHNCFIQTVFTPDYSDPNWLTVQL